MYRRLKNLLGVSLIILAIVLSQLPMGAVQADTTSQDGTEITNELPETDDETSEDTVNDEKKSNSDDTESDDDSTVDDIESDDDSAVTDDTESDGDSTVTDDTKSDDDSLESDVEKKEEERKNQPAVIDDTTTSDSSGTTDTDTNNQDGSTTTSTPTTYHTVNFNYGFLEVSSAITTQSIGDGMPIQIAEEDWKIDISGGESGKVLKEKQEYKVGSVTYKFLGWFTDKECTNYWEMSNDVDKDMTLYAGWSGPSEQVFVLTYYASGSSHEKQVVDDNEVGKRVVLPPNQPTKTGSTFIGWVEVVDGVDVPFNENEIPTQSKSYYARWEDKEYTVTFHANGGLFEGDKATDTLSVTKGKTIEEVGAFPVIKDSSYGSYQIADDNWYTDQECLTVFATTTPITSPITLYRKWVETTDKGFTISADGRVLYGFNGTQTEVVIPATVKIIATNAFSDMKNIESITLPAGISDIKANAFSGALNITRTISIYSMVDGSVDSKNEGASLANTYEHFEYVGSAGGTSSGSGSSGSPELDEKDINCSLSEVNRGIDDNGEFVYPQVYLPTDLPSGNYQMTFTELNNPTTLKTLLQKAGYDLSSNYVYYMDISLKKKDDVEGNKPTWSSGTMSIRMPLPVSWYGRDKAKIYMFTVSTAGTALEQVSISDISNNLFTFHPKHFSEFALVFTGKIVTDGSGSSSGGNSSGGSSSGGGSSSSGGSSGGSSSGSGSGSSSGSSSSGSGSSSPSSSAGGSTTTGTTPAVTTPTVTTPNIPLVTPAPTPGTQQTITTPTGTTGGSAGGTTAHVKDSTPKTGDPMEYRSILVCSFFSIGVLLLLIGNKKKTSSSSRYLRA